MRCVCIPVILSSEGNYLFEFKHACIVTVNNDDTLKIVDNLLYINETHALFNILTFYVLSIAHLPLYQYIKKTFCTSNNALTTTIRYCCDNIINAYL